MQKPPAATNAALYDKTMMNGLTGQHMVSKIRELMSSLKGSTKDPRKRKPTYATKQAAMVAGRK